MIGLTFKVCPLLFFFWATLPAQISPQIISQPCINDGECRDIVAGCLTAATSCVDGECRPDGDPILDHVQCDDGVFCNGAEFCRPLGLVGVCDSVPAPGPCLFAPTSGCLETSCNEILDECQELPVNTNCETGEYCDPSGECAELAACESDTDCPGPERVGDCGRVEFTCVEQLCTPSPASDDPTLCQDDLFCNGQEICDSTGCGDAPIGPCQVGDSIALQSDIPVDGCFDPTCSEDQDTCLSIPNSENCQSGEFCNPGGECQLVDEGVPTLTQWGLLAMTLSVLGLGILRLGYREPQGAG